MSKKQKVVTEKVRFSYCNVWEPKSINGGEAKHSVSLIIDKSDSKTLSLIKAAMDEAEKAGVAKYGAKFTSGSGFKRPLRDGDIDHPDDPSYKNSFFINLNSKDKPQIVDSRVRPITDRNEFYSGCYGRASFTIYPFSASGNRGLACYLANLQKLQDGEPLGGKSRAEEDFQMEDDDDFME
jgi:Protein of unknown function (DUF2815).